mmetsp:Transcript_32120/g.75417  ORF Transcript_32120/g.75417 Transcript_32120/m.75417 type:complete len:262 (-) Transcript_32120:215-1000(-)
MVPLRLRSAWRPHQRMIMLSVAAMLLVPPAWMSSTAWTSPGQSVAAGLRGSRLARVAAHAEGVASSDSAAAPESPAGEASDDEKIVGSWRYVAGVYEIRQQDGKLFFQEHVGGELIQQEDGWYEAVLQNAGTIRLRLHESGDKVVSRFKPADGDGDFGDEIEAVKEWETLESRTSFLEKELQMLEFTGSAADGAVVITMDGQQRPKDLQISKEAAAMGNLGSLVQQAHAEALEASLEGMTEKLRRLYTSHLLHQDVPAATR